MKNYLFMFAALALMVSSCKLQDDTLDPLQFNKIKKGSLLALRGKAFDNLVNDESYLGACDKFSITAPAADESIEFDADYISDDVNSLASVDVYAKYKKLARVKVATVQGSAFTLKDPKSDFPRGTIKVPLATILSALKLTTKDLEEETYIILESDLVLKDGSTIPSSSIVNSSLFEVAQFFPAQIVRYLAAK